MGSNQGLISKELRHYLWLAAAAAATLLLSNCDAGLTANWTEQFLRAHNVARSLVRVQPLQWSNKMASYAATLVAAQSIVSASCNLYQPPASVQYGMNQAVSNRIDSPPILVGSWVDAGKRYYSYLNNSCAAGHRNECDSYTQVVWRETTKLGCGKSNCGKDGTHVICLYSPRGNVAGEKPY